MEQAKKRDRKIYITDIAIFKISKSRIPCYTFTQNKLVDEKHIKLLTLAKSQNNSNETAILFDLDSDEEAIMYGTEYAVDIFENPNALMMANKKTNLFLAHNHPSTKNLSYADIGVFLMNDSINGLSAVSNTGDVHIIVKTSGFSFKKAFLILKNIREQFDILDEDADEKIVSTFLKNSNNMGIVYR